MSLPQGPVLIIIDPEGDLTVRLYKRTPDGETFTGASGDTISGRILASMKISRQVLIDNSPQLKALLTGHFKEARQNVVDVSEGTADSLELWFRVLHNKMTDKMYRISVPDVWEAIEVCGYRQFDIKKLQEWFARWLSHIDLKTLEPFKMRQLLYPCKEFDHARGFATLTRRLAYEVAEHITELNPTDHRHQHLDNPVIGALNGSKGSLRGKLLRGLFDPVGLFLHQTCSCKEKALFSYCTGVSKTGIWPLENHHKKSVQEILDSPGFENFNCAIPEGTCARCSGLLKPSRAELTRELIQTDFHGLCLDCMDKSKPKTGDVDTDYWVHDTRQLWSSGCRISHGQPTWYFSFMGRRETMRAHQANKRKHTVCMCPGCAPSRYR